MIIEYKESDEGFNEILNCYISGNKNLLDCDINEIFLKCEYLFKKNFDAFWTLNVNLLKNKFKNINIEKLEYFVLYPDIQQKIIDLDEEWIDIFILIINYLNVSYCDIFPVVDNILDNYSNYSNLLDSIDINNLNEECLHNLLIVLQNEDNYLNINDINELNNDNYEKIKMNYFRAIEEKINNNIDLAELRKNIFLKKFGMTIKQVELLINRYCKNIDLLDNSGLPKEDILILKTINYIYNCNNIEFLKYYFIGSFMFEDFYSAVSLEAKIRKDYAKLYNDTLYKVNDNDLVDEKSELYSSNKEIYNKLKNTTYNGKTPNFYLLKDDFNLQINVLGAYSDFKVPENFKNYWDRDKISSHGICTSYIGNNQLANARDAKMHPVYGFDGYENSALLLGGNYDLSSVEANKMFVASYGFTVKPSVFFSPKDLINFTRHTHNELVLERRNFNENNLNFKRQPSYIVYFVDDVNNIDNFNEDNSYYQETIQAAVDHDVPVLIIDRLYYAKRETDKCNKLMEEIFNNKQYNKINDLVVTYMNNVVGCIKYDCQELKEYHKYFTKEGFEKMYNTIIVNIGNTYNINNKKTLLLNLYKSIVIERYKTEVEGAAANLTSYYDTFDFHGKIVELENLIKELGVDIDFDNLSQEDVNNKINSFITTYYYDASDEIRNMIERDKNSGVSNDVIADKINNNIYETESGNSYGR